MTLTDFLLARIAEDEANIDGDWAGGDGGLHIISTPMRDRLLAECKAKYLIVDDFERQAMDCREYPGEFNAGRRYASLLAATRLAAVYADHPDYDEEWRP